MCLMILAWKTHPRYPLVVAANRDEFHRRPAAALHSWAEPGGIAAGRDLEAGGTWLAVDARQRFGIVTNFRELSRTRQPSPSRGELIPQFLRGQDDARTYLARLEERAPDYAGFNLLLRDGDALWYASNRMEEFARELPPGIYGVSNHYLDTPWQKLERVRGTFSTWVRSDAGTEALFGMLGDSTPAETLDVPPSGRSAEFDRAVSAPFVVNSDYGTRCSTVVALGGDAPLITERRFEASGATSGETTLRLVDDAWR